MQNINIYPILATWKKSKKNLFSIHIRIDIDGVKAAYPSIKKRIKKEEWDMLRKRVKDNHPNAAHFNALIQQRIGEYQSLITSTQLQHITITKQLIQNLLTGNEKSDNFIQFYRTYIDNLKITKKKAYSTIQIWETEYNTLIAYSGNSVPFSAITMDFLNGYHQFLSSPKKEGRKIVTYASTTIFKKLKKIRQIIKLAIDRGRINHEQIQGFEMVKYEQPEKSYLTLEQCKSIENAIYGGKYDHDDTLRQTACYFLVGCYSALRISDWRRFTVEKLIDNESLKVQAQKNKEPIYLSFKTFTSLAKIINYIRDNNIEFNIEDQTANRMICFMAQIASIQTKITAHSSRHTFATLSAEKGYSPSWIAQAMGVTERTAMTYIKITRRGLDAEAEKNGGW